MAADAEWFLEKKSSALSLAAGLGLMKATFRERTVENNLCKPNVYGLEHCFHIVGFSDYADPKDHEDMREMCCWCGVEKITKHGTRLPETFRSIEAFKNKFYPHEKR